MANNTEHEYRRRLWDSRFVKKGDVILAFFLRGLFVFSLIYSICAGYYHLIPITAVSFALTFLPAILERSIMVSLPASRMVRSSARFDRLSSCLYSE